MRRTADTDRGNADADCDHADPDSGHTDADSSHADRDTYGLANANTRAGCASSTCCWRNRTGIPRQAAGTQETESETNELKFDSTSRNESEPVAGLAGRAL